MKLFLDRNIPIGLVSHLKYSTWEVIHHDSVFSDPKTGDDEIIQFVVNGNYVLVTRDRRMVRVHKIALQEFRPQVIFFTAAIGRQKIADQIKWCATVWVKVCGNLDILKPGMQIRVDLTGDIREIWKPEDTEDTNVEEGDMTS